MFIACAIVSVLLAAVLLGSAIGKLMRHPRVMTTMHKVGFPDEKLWLLALAETAGALGLVAGLFWWPLGAAAALGVIGYFVGAVAGHLRVRDTDLLPAGLLLLTGVVAFGLRVLSA